MVINLCTRDAHLVATYVNIQQLRMYISVNGNLKVEKKDPLRVFNVFKIYLSP